MKTAKQFILFLFLAILVSGCAHVISSDLRLKVDPSLTFSEVLRDPDANKGKIVLWGGEILQVILQDRTTFVEVLKWPLGWRGNPQRAVTFQGRFLILVEEPLDLSFYQAGKRVTVAGEVQGAIKGDEIKNLSESIYRYPLVLSKQIHLWKDYFYPYSSIRQRDPWSYDPSDRELRF